jgi:glycosyltransferase involved in cell wall biosynthesis
MSKKKKIRKRNVRKTKNKVIRPDFGQQNNEPRPPINKIVNPQIKKQEQMLTKETIMVYSDYHKSVTGFARQMAAILPGLRDKYNIVEMAIGAEPQHAIEEAQKYGNVVIPTNPQGGRAANPSQYYGKDVLNKVLKEMNDKGVKPKFIFVNHDIQCFQFIGNVLKNNGIPIIYWYLLDNDFICYEQLSLLSIPDIIIYQTEFSRKTVCEHLPCLDGPVIYPSIDTEWLKSVKPEQIFGSNEYLKKIDGKKVVFCNMKNQRRKNFAVMFEAIKIIDKRATTDIVFIIHCPPPIDTQLEALDLGQYLWRVNLSENRMIINDKPVPNDIINAWYELADLLVIPSCSEGLGMIFLEAFYKKVPVVSTNYAASSEILGNGRGYLINPVITIFQNDKNVNWSYISAEDLANGIEYMVKADTQSFVDSGREFVDKYNSSRQTLELIRVFEQCLKMNEAYSNPLPVQLII